MAIILKMFVKFTLKELRCEFSSSFDIISGSEEGGILFLQGFILQINVFQNPSILDICRDICWQVRKTQPI